eukprot:IDg4500t1
MQNFLISGNPVNYKKATHLIFYVCIRGDGTSTDPTNIVPPALHIKLGLINKIIAALDGVVTTWNELKDWKKKPEDSLSPAMLLLATSLANIGVRRERYFAGALSGVPCTKFMQNINEFCRLFFHTPADGWGTI